MAIDWESVGDKAFNVQDPHCGFWTEDGFTNDQHKAKTYTRSELIDEEKQVIINHGCRLLSA